MFFVYVLRSIHRNYIYVGLTSDLERRISDHNQGYNRTTKPYKPFKTILMEQHD
jgi:putative endonuclease